MPIKNDDYVKPKGGLWASPVNSRYGWREWCDENDFGDISTNFFFTFEGELLVIDSVADLELMDWYTVKTWCDRLVPDFEKILRDGFGAIHLTEKGLEETRDSRDKNLYGWDCETVLVMNPNAVNFW